MDTSTNQDNQPSNETVVQSESHTVSETRIQVESEPNTQPAQVSTDPVNEPAASNDNANNNPDAMSIENTEEKPENDRPHEANADHQIMNTNHVKVYCFGSAECDQFYIGEDRYVTKKPILIPITISGVDNQVYSIACGSLHTLILLTNGEVYSLGCNDDGALGRTGEESKPAKVDLPLPVDMISAGDSHSTATNSTNSVVFQWGCYRNVLKGNLAKSETPHRIGEEEFHKKKIRKVISGSNHTLVLANNKVYVWGDSDAGILGRLPTERRRVTQGLSVEGLGITGVEDIFTGAFHSFLIKKYERKGQETRSKLLAWGLNNEGQLGIGSLENTHIPTEVRLNGGNIVEVAGGDYFSIFRTDNGDVYGCGKNDDGQLGLGKDYVYQEPQDDEDEEVAEEPKEGEEKAKEGEEEKPAAKAKPAEPVTNKDRALRPVKISGIADSERIYAKANYCYAIGTNQEIYSWGMGDNFILGNREEETVYEPTKLNLDYFKGKVVLLDLGSQHVAYGVLENTTLLPKLHKDVFEVNDAIKKKVGRPKREGEIEEEGTEKKEPKKAGRPKKEKIEEEGTEKKETKKDGRSKKESVEKDEKKAEKSKKREGSEEKKEKKEPKKAGKSKADAIEEEKGDKKDKKKDDKKKADKKVQKEEESEEDNEEKEEKRGRKKEKTDKKDKKEDKSKSVKKGKKDNEKKSVEKSEKKSVEKTGKTSVDKAGKKSADKEKVEKKGEKEKSVKKDKKEEKTDKKSVEKTGKSSVDKTVKKPVEKEKKSVDKDKAGKKSVDKEKAGKVSVDKEKKSVDKDKTGKISVEKDVKKSVDKEKVEKKGEKEKSVKKDKKEEKTDKKSVEKTGKSSVDKTGKKSVEKEKKSVDKEKAGKMSVEKEGKKSVDKDEEKTKKRKIEGETNVELKKTKKTEEKKETKTTKKK